MTSVVLSDPTGTYGVKRVDTGAVVVAAGVVMTHTGVGVYKYTFTDPAFDLSYAYCVKVVYGGETYYIEGTLTGPTSGTEVESLATLKDYIKRRLGWPVVEIEMTNDQLTDVVNDSTRLFNRYLVVPMLKAYMSRGTTESCALSCTSAAETKIGSVVIDYPDDVNGVLYCTQLRIESALAEVKLTVFDILFRMLPASLPVGTWYMYRSFYDMYQRARGTYPWYQIDPVARKLYVDCFSGPYNIFVIWAKNVAWTDFLSGSLISWKDDFLRACIAHAKERLGYERGKFMGIPAPGGTLTTDAERMSTDSRQDIDKITAALDRRTRALVIPRWG
jgi:hypothetical protein